MKRCMKADMGLMFITICWGASFLLVKNSVSSVPTYNFLAIRFVIAFLISSLVFAAIFAYIVNSEVLSIIGICGAALIIVGMLISEIDLKELRVSK